VAGSLIRPPPFDKPHLFRRPDDDDDDVDNRDPNDMESNMSSRSEWICVPHNRRYTELEKFEEHIAGSKHKKDDKPYCPECELIFNTEFQLFRHVSDVHNERFENPLICSFHCGYFRRCEDFEEHVAGIDHKLHGKPYCPDCKRTFGSEFALRDHLLAYRDKACASDELDYSVNCFICEKTLENFHAFLDHIVNARVSALTAHRAFACCIAARREFSRLVGDFILTWRY
jgi:hypothetical protein